MVKYALKMYLLLKKNLKLKIESQAQIVHVPAP